MRIVHVLWNLKFGGAETMLVDILNYQARNTQVELVVINNAIDKELFQEINTQVRITLIKRPLGSKNIFPILKLNYLLFSRKIDIIHIHQDDIIRYLPIRHFLNNLCLTVHSVKIDTKDIKKYNHLFAISPAVQKKITELSQKKSFLVLNGINVASFTRKQINPQAVQKISKIALIGRLTPLKGHFLLLDASIKLIKDYGIVDFQIDFIGDGEIREELLCEINSLELSTYINLLGTKSKKYIRQHLHEYDLLVQPSASEGFGLTAVEAMAAEIPVLVSDIDSLKDIAKDGDMGYIFKSGDANDLALKIMEVIHLDEKQKREKCRQAHEYVTTEYDVSQTAQRYLDLYNLF